MTTSPDPHPPAQVQQAAPDDVPALPLVKLIAEILARAERSLPGADKVA